MNKDYIICYPVFCLVGAGLEWCYGAFWNAVGTAPWIYPNSCLHYTSFEGVPLWGFGGVLCVSIYRAITKRNSKLLLGAVISVALGALWIILYSVF